MSSAEKGEKGPKIWQTICTHDLRLIRKGRREWITPLLKSLNQWGAGDRILCQHARGNLLLTYADKREGGGGQKSENLADIIP